MKPATGSLFVASSSRVAAASWHADAVPHILDRLETDSRGLADDEALRRLERFGLNRLTPHPPASAGKILLDQLRSVVVGLLVAGVVISIMLGG